MAAVPACMLAVARPEGVAQERSPALAVSLSALPSRSAPVSSETAVPAMMVPFVNILAKCCRRAGCPIDTRCVCSCRQNHPTHAFGGDAGRTADAENCVRIALRIQVQSNPWQPLSFSRIQFATLLIRTIELISAGESSGEQQSRTRDDCRCRRRQLMLAKWRFSW